MSFQEQLEKMKNIHKNLLEFIEKEDSMEENFQNLFNILDEQKIHKNRYELKSFLHMLTSIADNHYRSSNFFSKIEKILTTFKDEIKNFYSNYEIFSIFGSNKRILLFLIEENLITLDKTIQSLISSGQYKKANYPLYFLTETKPPNFEENRKLGENENNICKLIREDNIDDFISFINQNNTSLQTEISPSLFESNLYLLTKSPTLIEYAAFFGSIQIFKYLHINTKVTLSNELIISAIHGDNPELFSYINENFPNDKKFPYNECVKESILCHHNETANYFINNYLQFEENKSSLINFAGLQSHNFAFIANESINQSAFFDLCKYDYSSLVKILLETSKININECIILIHFFLNRILILIFGYNFDVFVVFKIPNKIV